MKKHTFIKSDCLNFAPVSRFGPGYFTKKNEKLEQIQEQILNYDTTSFVIEVSLNLKVVKKIIANTAFVKT